MLQHLNGTLVLSALKSFIFLMGLLAITAAFAADVEIRVSNQVSATADFRPGAVGKPAVLVLHGFLQTREFAIVKSLVDALSDAGYTVLSPNLSLGITYRKRSLSCEALHLHGMDEDLKEIQLWMQWLKDRGYKKIAGIGHSFGAAQLIAWAEQHPDSHVSIIGISMVGSTPFANSGKADSKALNMPDAKLLHAPLSFCETYTAPVKKYISYYKWNEKRVLAAIKTAKLNTDVILGSEDKYLPRNWERELATAGTRTHLIKGANHFMEGTHEFDMIDTSMNILKTRIQ